MFARIAYGRLHSKAIKSTRFARTRKVWRSQWRWWWRRSVVQLGRRCWATGRSHSQIWVYGSWSFALSSNFDQYKWNAFWDHSSNSSNVSQFIVRRPKTTNKVCLSSLSLSLYSVVQHWFAFPNTNLFDKEKVNTVDIRQLAFLFVWLLFELQIDC